MKCNICGNKIGNNHYEIRGGLGNKHLANMCAKCYDEYKKYSNEKLKALIEELKDK